MTRPSSNVQSRQIALAAVCASLRNALLLDLHSHSMDLFLVYNRVILKKKKRKYAMRENEERYKREKEIEKKKKMFLL